MKANDLPFLSKFNIRGKDVFSRTEWRLTRVYSGLLILFLALFIIIVYTVLYFFILKIQERELQTLVSQESSFLEKYLVENNLNDFRSLPNQEVVFAGVNQAFYYVVNSNGDIIMGNDSEPRMRHDLTRILNDNIQNRDDIRVESIYVQGSQKGRGRPGEFHHPEEPHTIHLMIASHSIYHNGKWIGQLYIGKDISFVYELFKWVIVVLAAIGIIFFGIALLVSRKMSQKAMIPISEAFSKQREFVADASHELRTPLSVLLSSIDVMEMTFEPDNDDFSGKLLTSMRQEVKRMTNLVSDLLTLARSDSSAVEVSLETFDIAIKAKETLESLRPLALEKKIKAVMVAPETLKAFGDQQRLSQLLYILLDNAIKYTPTGGEVKLILSQLGSDLRIAVQDTGIGIKKEDHERIFERFYRSDKSRTRQISGHGLGLSIAKWIVETHHGTIKVSSEIGKGSTFLVSVPNQV